MYSKRQNQCQLNTKYFKLEPLHFLGAIGAWYLEVRMWMYTSIHEFAIVTIKIDFPLFRVKRFWAQTTTSIFSSFCHPVWTGQVLQQTVLAIAALAYLLRANWRDNQVLERRRRVFCDSVHAASNWILDLVNIMQVLEGLWSLQLAWNISTATRCTVFLSWGWLHG